MILRKKRIACALTAVALTIGIQPVALAEPTTGHAEKDVMMGYPLGGEHKVRFATASICSWPSGKGNEPVRQTISANAYDLDAPSNGNIFSLHSFFPFNSSTIKWENKTTGNSGTETVRNNGREVGVSGVETGTGDINVSITVTRSLLPIIIEDFPLSSAWSATHSESFFIKGIDPAACEAAPG